MNPSLPVCMLLKALNIPYYYAVENAEGTSTHMNIQWSSMVILFQIIIIKQGYFGLFPCNWHIDYRKLKHSCSEASNLIHNFDFVLHVVI